MAQHEKPHEGLIVGNRSIKYPYSHIKCFRVSLFVSYLHWYMAMETDHQSKILRFIPEILVLVFTCRERILKTLRQINLCRLPAWSTCHDPHMQVRVKLSVHIL